MYQYKVKSIVRVVDGDTVVALVDLGFHVTMEETFRLYGINAPEKRGEEKEKGIASLIFLDSLIREADSIEIETLKDTKGKYGRYLAKLYGNYGPSRLSINDRMVECGHAVYQEY